MSLPADPDSPARRSSRGLVHTPATTAHSRAEKSKPTIIPADKSDIPEMARIYMKAYRGMEEYGEPNTDRAAAYLIQLHRFCPLGIFKAVVNGRTAGFIFCDPEWREKNSSKVLEIHELAVDPDFQGYGLGGFLMRFASEVGRKHGRSTVSLWAGEGNNKAIEWYKKKYGFRQNCKAGIWIRFEASVEQIGRL